MSGEFSMFENAKSTADRVINYSAMKFCLLTEDGFYQDNEIMKYAWKRIMKFPYS